ncbi:amidohydrolase family protein [Streptomyces canus]|uniref:amidohydrolase family protein n=1 Tax=Streptomyces canus TaxID=58343 RepID=UPI002E3635D3|nr:amidohydrolase family protein [Streptomyces canus]
MNKHTTAPGEAVDIHAHVVPAGLLADLTAGRLRFPHVETATREGGQALSFNGGHPTRPVTPGLTDPARRTAWLDAQRIDRQVVGGWLDIFGYQLPADEGADWAEALTLGIVEHAKADSRLIPLGTVALQDPERAAQALKAQRAAGLPGIMIATRAGELELDDPAFTPFWEVADETRAVVFLHPGFGAASPRYHDFGLVNGLARLEDTTVALARLLYTGIPDRFPGARILVAHGGAALPYVLGRLVRNHLTNPDTTADPLASFARLYFDSVLFDPAALEFLVAKAGPGRVLLGSDYPFPIGDLSPRTVVESAQLDPAERGRILGGSAAALLGEQP